MARCFGGDELIDVFDFEGSLGYYVKSYVLYLRINTLWREEDWDGTCSFTSFIVKLG